VLDREECDARALHAGSKENTPDVGEEPDAELDDEDGRHPEGTRSKEKRKHNITGTMSVTSNDEQTETDGEKLKRLLLKLGLAGEGANMLKCITRYADYLYLCTRAYLLLPALQT